jgi:excisionase family DNA binding protein
VAKSWDDTITQRKTLLIGEFAQQSGLSDSTVRRGCKSGKIRSIRLGKRFLIPITELDRLFDVAIAANVAETGKLFEEDRAVNTAPTCAIRKLAEEGRAAPVVAAAVSTRRPARKKPVAPASEGNKQASTIRRIARKGAAAHP